MACDTYKDARTSNPLIQRLRARKFFWLNGAVWMMGSGPDNDCQEAAAEIEQLQQTGDELLYQRDAALAERDRLRDEYDQKDAECAMYRLENDRLRAALSGLIDAYYGNSYDTWHKAMIRAREALDRPKDRPAE